MDSAQVSEASAAAQQLARVRWGDTKVRRAAAVVIERVAELPDAVRAELHQMTEQEGVDR